MKKNYKKIYKKNYLLKDFNFVMIHRIRKMLILLKNHLNHLKDNNFERFLRYIISFYFFKQINIFHNI